MNAPLPPRALHTNLRNVVVTAHRQPGTLSQIVSLLLRRGYDLERMASLPNDDGRTVSIWLQVAEDEDEEHLVKQLRKLSDVLAVRDLGPYGDILAQLRTRLAEMPREG